MGNLQRVCACLLTYHVMIAKKVMHPFYVGEVEVPVTLAVSLGPSRSVVTYIVNCVAQRAPKQKLSLWR